MKKPSRSEDVRILLRTYTGVTGNKIPSGLLTTIGNQVGLSKERVRQIAVKEKYIMPHKTARLRIRKAKCKECGKTFSSETSYIPICCSPECYKKRRERLYFATTKCKYCGKDIKYFKSLEKSGRKPVFHNKICQGKYLGKFHGGKRRARWNMSASELKKFLPNDFTINQFIKRFNYSPNSQGNVSKILEYLINKGFVKRVPHPKIKKQGFPPNYYQVITKERD